MPFLCNEAINIYKKCLHWFENFSNKEYLHAICFQEQFKMANASTPILDPQQNLAVFEKQNCIFCKDTGSTWQPQLWRNQVFAVSSSPPPFFLINEKDTAPVGAEKYVVVVIMEPFRSYSWDSAKARWRCSLPCGLEVLLPPPVRMPVRLRSCSETFWSCLGRKRRNVVGLRLHEDLMFCGAYPSSVCVCTCASSTVCWMRLSACISTSPHPPQINEVFLFSALPNSPDSGSSNLALRQMAAFPRMFPPSSTRLPPSILDKWVYSSRFTSVFLCVASRPGFSTGTALRCF